MSFNPGCFGAPSVFSFKSMTCAACPAFSRCRVAAFAELRLNAGSECQAIQVDLIAHERAERDLSAPVGEVEVRVGIDTGKALRARPSRSKRPRFDLTQTQEQMVASVSKNIAARLEKLFRSGSDIQIFRSIRNGDSSFSLLSGQRSLVLALQMLSDKRVTKSGLKAAYMDSLGWTDLSARSEVTIMWKILPKIGVAVGSLEDSLVLAPDLANDNSCIRQREK